MQFRNSISESRFPLFGPFWSRTSIRFSDTTRSWLLECDLTTTSTCNVESVKDRRNKQIECNMDKNSLQKPNKCSYFRLDTRRARYGCLKPPNFRTAAFCKLERWIVYVTVTTWVREQRSTWNKGHVEVQYRLVHTTVSYLKTLGDEWGSWQ